MKIPFPSEARKEYFRLLDEIFDSNFWSEGNMVRRFEEEFSKYTNLHARTISNGGAGLLAILNYIDVRNAEVIVPTNTFWASTRAIQMAGGIPIFSDISREDLCITAENILNNITSRTKAVLVVHIAGHIAFDIDAIVTLCQDKNIVLIEDCAHAHGASFKGRVAGQFGLAGAYSFYATKSLPLGEGGMVVSSDENFIKWVEKYRNYGKAIKKEQVTYPMLDGFNFRINEFTAALGLVQLKRFPQILDWKRSLAIKYDQIFNRHITFPKQMLSGFYKYVVWDYPDIIEKTGQVFGPNDLNHKIANAKKSFPNAEWVTKHHQCLPIYNGWDHAHKSVEELASYLIPNNS